MNMQLLKRNLLVLVIFSIFYMLLISRLAYIQIFATEHFSEKGINLIKKSVQQRQQELILHSGRGIVLDRNGQELTGTDSYVLALFPMMKKSSIPMEKLEELARIVNLPPALFSQYMDKLREPFLYKTSQGLLQLTEEQANQINQLELPGILGLPYELRYDFEHLSAQHFIGFLGENPELVRTKYAQELAQGFLKENTEIGISGLEKTFQPFLQGIGPTSLAYLVDGRGYPLQGIEIKYSDQENPFYPLMIQTTLDREVQEKVEETLNNYTIDEGTVVILDAKTSEVIAMASRPNVVGHMDVTTAWENKALKRYPLGSIFKIVIAAAALEKGIVDMQQKFHCDGVLEGTNFHCWLKEGHGSLTFEEGFAYSCNIVFGQVAQQLGADAIQEYAQKLGLLEQNGWHKDTLFYLQNFTQLDGEEKGQVYDPIRISIEKEDPSYLLQTGIGQLDVQATPLAVANMLATINRGGQKYQVKGVQNILYQTGGIFYNFPKQKIEGATISQYTAYQLQQLLALVTEKGTASSTLKERGWKAAGKTGTAQVLKNKYGSDEYMQNHQWFAGYYPQYQPEYIIISLTLNRQPNTGNVSIDIFADIVDWLNENK